MTPETLMSQVVRFDFPEGGYPVVLQHIVIYQLDMLVWLYGTFLFPSMTAIKGAVVYGSEGGRSSPERVLSISPALAYTSRKIHPFFDRSIPGWTPVVQPFLHIHLLTTTFASSSFHPRRRCLAFSFSHPLVTRVYWKFLFSAASCRGGATFGTTPPFHKNLSRLYIPSIQTRKSECARVELTT